MSYITHMVAHPYTVYYVARQARQSLFNIAWRRVGGLTFVKIGRLTLSYGISAEYRPFKRC